MAPTVASSDAGPLVIEAPGDQCHVLPRGWVAIVPPPAQKVPTGFLPLRLAAVPGYQAPEYHPAFEEYCEAIFELHEDDVDVIQARIAERLQVSRPAVSEMIRRMEAEGFVEIDRHVTLTANGVKLAEQVVRRHRLAERLLTDILGLSWAEAHQEAGKWEHIISDRVERAIVSLLEGPTTCPHGNPIPGSDYVEPASNPLADLRVGESFTVLRIPEALEFTPGLLEFLEDASILPGHSGTVTASSPDGTTTIEMDGRHIGVGSFASTRILVTTPDGK